jgi:hypothetical protein
MVSIGVPAVATRVKLRKVVLALAVAAFFPAAANAAPFGIEPQNEGPFLEALTPPGHWIVGVTLDRASGLGRVDDEDLVDDQLFGLSGTYQRGWFGLNLKMLVTPQRVSPRTRAGLVLGVRASYSALGRRWIYGVGLQGDAVLDDHHWILYASPVEIGFDVFTHNSFHAQLFVGARYALRGGLITNFLIDPNGFPHPEFEAILDDKLDNPWEGFVSLVFARRVD